MDVFNEGTEINSETAYRIAKLLPDELFYKLKRKIDTLTLDKKPISIEELLQDMTKAEAKKIKKVVVKEKPKFVRQISKKTQKKMLEKKKKLEEAKANLERIKKDIEDRN